MSDENLNVYVAGHKGMVGSSICRKLRENSDVKIIKKNRSELDLTNQKLVNDFFLDEKIHQVYLAAAKVGGIHANNTYPADFIYQNLLIEANVIDAAFRNGVKKLLLLGSSCIYPKLASQPLKEDYLLSSALESTNEPYAIAKIAGIKMCESYNRQFGKSHGIDYRCIMPTNLYGPGDNYHPENSHVIPGLIRRIHEAKVSNKSSVAVWGTGAPRREFLYADDAASACIYIMNLDSDIYHKHTHPMLSHINAGCGYDITIKELAETISKIIDFKGEITFDSSKPDGTPRKLLDSSLLNTLGWQAKTDLEEGIAKTYQDFVKNIYA